MLGQEIPSAAHQLATTRGFGIRESQIALSIVEADGRFKVVDQGNHASVNAVNSRKFVEKLFRYLIHTEFG